jgi:hypothetical protein
MDHEWNTTEYKAFPDFDVALSHFYSRVKLVNMITEWHFPVQVPVLDVEKEFLRSLATFWLPKNCTHDDVRAWHDKIKNDPSLFVIIGSDVVRVPASLSYYDAGNHALIVTL